MNALELLRFDFNRNEQRVLLAALAVGHGPCPPRVWAVRAGVPANHIWPVLRKLAVNGVIVIHPHVEGLLLTVAPLAQCRVTQLHGEADWRKAWAWDCEASIELPGMDGLQAEAAPVVGNGDRNPVGLPESGGVTGIRSRSTSDVKRSNVSDLKRETFNVTCGGPESGLRAAVREFVGERDWGRYWGRAQYANLFDDPARAGVLRDCLAYVKAGLAEGNCTVKKSRGAMLWDEFRRTEREGLKA